MRITKKVIEKIIEHAKREMPIEACGYLAAQDGNIICHYEMANTDKAREHFSFDPNEQFAVLRDARAKGLKICAVYHSHPTTPARPSAEDIKLAFDRQLSYVIVSLASEVADVQSFKIRDSKVEPEHLEIIDDDQL